MPQLVGKTINDVIERNGLEIKKITQEKDKIEYTVTHYVEVEKKAYLEQKCDSKGNHCIYEINPPTTAQMLCGYDIITDKNNIILSASKRVIASNCNLK
ncbi:MAG: hypothetical protein LBF97_01300 [Elusimicrobiota bacterium]|jgi:hypothetical protein|nr:hypothetical protein [Elusimicrobiota bacterium]